MYCGIHQYVVCTQRSASEGLWEEGVWGGVKNQNLIIKLSGSKKKKRGATSYGLRIGLQL